MSRASRFWGKAAIAREATLAGAYFESLDLARRRFGLFLECLGFGSHPTPSRSVCALRAATLLAYQAPHQQAPAVLLVPAPIKRPYIWDLAPESSVVRRCLEAGLQVYLLAWSRPRPADSQLGLAEYADHMMLESLEAIGKETGQRKVFLVGHSLGGTLAAIFSSLHPERVLALIALEAPMAFGVGRIDVAATAGVPGSAVTGALGNVPGTTLDWLSVCADPHTYQIEPWTDWVECSGSPAARELHLRVRRWMLDETAMAGRLFEEVLDRLYRENRFAQRALEVEGRLADPRAMVMPILGVVDRRSRIVPPRSVEAYRSCTRSSDVEIADYSGDNGVVMQHIGVLVGQNAHRLLWPRVLQWVRRHASD